MTEEILMAVVFFSTVVSFFACIGVIIYAIVSEDG